MRTYSVKTPRWLPRLFPQEIVWNLHHSPSVYLTFDDGPHPVATPYVLDTLKLYGAKATFFCIGKNIQAHPDLYNRLIAEGHRTGNHTFNHLNGWTTTNADYLKNIIKTNRLVAHKIFRPPYGKIKISQAQKLLARGWKIYMWDVLSADFDVRLSAADCINNVIPNIQPGSIIVFHDSQKAFPRMKDSLPAVLDYCRQQGYNMEVLPLASDALNTETNIPHD